MIFSFSELRNTVFGSIVKQLLLLAVISISKSIVLDIMVIKVQVNYKEVKNEQYGTYLEFVINNFDIDIMREMFKILLNFVLIKSFLFPITNFFIFFFSSFIGIFFVFYFF